MKKTLAYTLAVVISLSVACKKSDKSELPPEPEPKMTFSGITETDNKGNNTGAVDNTDWTNDASWNADETKLLAFADTVNLNGTDTCKVLIWPAYPNAAKVNDTVFVNVKTTKKVNMAVMMVDGFFQKYTKEAEFNLSPGVVNIVPFVMSGTYQTGKLYRLYYGFSALNHKMFYKGHGDIKIQ